MTGFIVSLKEIAHQVISTPHLVKENWNYDDYWKNKRNSRMGWANQYQQARAEWIKLHIHPGDTVLDLGCGDGAMLLALMSRIMINPVGADISDYALAYLESQGVTTHKCDLSNTSCFDDLPEVDHILMLEVLEHLPQPEEFLRTALKKAKQSVIFSFPNTGYISYRLRMMTGRFPVQWRINPGEHLRFWTYSDLKWWLGELGMLEDSHISAYEGVPGINNFWPSLFGAGLIAQVKSQNF